MSLNIHAFTCNKNAFYSLNSGRFFLLLCVDFEEQENLICIFFFIYHLKEKSSFTKCKRRILWYSCKMYLTNFSHENELIMG